jgi:hypothetical protein
MDGHAAEVVLKLAMQRILQSKSMLIHGLIATITTIRGQAKQNKHLHTFSNRYRELASFLA